MRVVPPEWCIAGPRNTGRENSREENKEMWKEDEKIRPHFTHIPLPVPSALYSANEREEMKGDQG
jgi:hypothetical protein